VAADVVEDVGLGQVLQLGAVADRDRGRELAPAQAIEEHVRRDVAADGPCAEAGQRLQEVVDLLEARDAIRRQLQLGEPFQEAFVRVAFPAIVHAPQQGAPGRLVLGGVQLVRLVDVDVAV